MIDVSVANLEEIGRAAGLAVAGAGAIFAVEVFSGVDRWDRPAYYFNYQVDEERLQHSPGLVQIRLVQKLSDDLAERHDDHLPIVRLLRPWEWEQRTRFA